MLSEASGLSENRIISLCQHHKSQDTWHLKTHQDELIGRSTEQLSFYQEQSDWLKNACCFIFPLMSHGLRSEWKGRQSLRHRRLWPLISSAWSNVNLYYLAVSKLLVAEHTFGDIPLEDTRVEIFFSDKNSYKLKWKCHYCQATRLSCYVCINFIKFSYNENNVNLRQKVRKSLFGRLVLWCYNVP